MYALLELDVTGIRQISKKPLTLKKRFGTTYVTSVGGFSDANGFIIPYIAGQTRPLAFAIGNIVKKTCVFGSEIKIREFLSMTVAINHDLVDGAPAARFISRLKQIIEGNYQDNRDH
jgi:pyruvate/2-oxoglutarate dehydrogenase complex dihydrolipoamide acyltransferase (E2) component